MRENKNFTKLTQKKGISLIVLIVTIIVIIILAAVVILTITKNNPIENAKEATFKEDVRSFQDDLALFISKEYTDNQGQRDEKINSSGEDVKNYISSFTDKYVEKFGIKDDKLVANSTNVTDKEKEWLTSLNIEVIDINANYEVIFFDWGADDEDVEGYNTIIGYKTENWHGKTILTLPERCKKIELAIMQPYDSNARTYDEGIQKLILPNSVEVIGEYAFDGFTALREINIPDSVKSFGAYSFSYCRNLKNMIIPNSVVSIERYAFEGCSNLTNVTIPNSVTSIADNIFGNCGSLTNINFKGTKNEWNNISKGSWWNNASSISTITCTDGVITLT